jgi:hypothetical protein
MLLKRQNIDRIFLKRVAESDKEHNFPKKKSLKATKIIARVTTPGTRSMKRSDPEAVAQPAMVRSLQGRIVCHSSPGVPACGFTPGGEAGIFATFGDLGHSRR